MDVGRERLTHHLESTVHWDCIYSKVLQQYIINMINGPLYVQVIYPVCKGVIQSSVLPEMV